MAETWSFEPEIGRRLDNIKPPDYKEDRPEHTSSRSGESEREKDDIHSLYYGRNTAHSNVNKLDGNSYRETASVMSKSRNYTQNEAWDTASQLNGEPHGIPTSFFYDRNKARAVNVPTYLAPKSSDNPSHQEYPSLHSGVKVTTKSADLDHSSSTKSGNFDLQEPSPVADKSKFQEIYDTVSQALSSQSSDPKITSTFEIDWDVLALLQDEDYNGTSDRTLGSVLTLTGSPVNADAASASEYMCRTWPSSGVELLKIIQECVNSANHYALGSLLNGMKIRVEMRIKKTYVIACGSQKALSMLGQQLSWLGAALRSTSSGSGLSTCAPFVEKIARGNHGVEFQISFSIHRIELDPALAAISGTCWHHLFKGAVIVEGFPTRQRKNNEIGLELPLDVMSSLGEAPYATDFQGMLLLKGFCTLFVVTQRQEKSLTWHFVFDKDGRRLPYHQIKEHCRTPLEQDDVDLSTLEDPEVRHFVGWASSVTRHLGTKDAEKRDIIESGAKPSSSQIVLDKLSITGGKYVTVGTSIEILPRWKVKFAKDPSYHGQIHSARRIFFVMYDKAERRGWVVDGASTLLHIVLAKLSSKPFKDEASCCFDRKKFQYPEVDGGPDAAMQCLLDQDNMAMPVLDEPSTLVRKSTISTPKSTELFMENKVWMFKEIVERIWCNIEKIYDQHIFENASSNKDLREIFRSNLVGHDLFDLVATKMISVPRSESLKSNGPAWLGFIRAIDAVPLLGCGLGDLLKPGQDCGTLCPAWSEVPKQQEYLAVPFSIIREIGTETFSKGWSLEEPLARKHGSDCSGKHVKKSCTRAYRLVRRSDCQTFPNIDNLIGDADGALIVGDRSSFGIPSSHQSGTTETVSSQIPRESTSTQAPKLSELDVSGSIMESPWAEKIEVNHSQTRPLDEIFVNRNPQMDNTGIQHILNIWDE